MPKPGYKWFGWLLLILICGSFWGRGAVQALRWLAKNEQADRAKYVAWAEKLLAQGAMSYRFETDNLLVVQAEISNEWRLGESSPSFDEARSPSTIVRGVEVWAADRKFPFHTAVSEAHLDADVVGGTLECTRTIVFPDQVSPRSLDIAIAGAKKMSGDLGVLVSRTGRTASFRAKTTNPADDVQLGILGPFHKCVSVCWTVLDGTQGSFSRDEVLVRDNFKLNIRLVMRPVLP